VKNCLPRGRHEPERAHLQHRGGSQAHPQGDRDTIVSAVTAYADAGRGDARALKDQPGFRLQVGIISYINNALQESVWARKRIARPAVDVTVPEAELRLGAASIPARSKVPSLLGFFINRQQQQCGGRVESG
jgi:hypothetical protein